MPRAPFEHVNAGEPKQLSAREYNAFIAMASPFRNRGRDSGPRLTPPPLRSAGLVLVKNNSGADRVSFEVLGIDAPLYTPTESAQEFNNQVVLKGITPTSAHYGKFVVLAEPIDSGEIGRAYIDGVCPALLNVAVDADPDDYAEVDPDATDPTDYLKPGATGSARVLWRESGTGTKKAIVQLGSPNHDALAQIQSYTKHASGSHYVVKIRGGGSWSTTTYKMVLPKDYNQIDDDPAEFPDGMFVDGQVVPCLANQWGSLFVYGGSATEADYVCLNATPQGVLA
jgi:hypothetical protein